MLTKLSKHRSVDCELVIVMKKRSLSVTAVHRPNRNKPCHRRSDPVAMLQKLTLNVLEMAVKMALKTAFFLD